MQSTHVGEARGSIRRLADGDIETVVAFSFAAWAPVFASLEAELGSEIFGATFPDWALPAIATLGRSPLTISEGISWLLQEPKVLERNHCFMTIASRKSQGPRLDARTPAIWISGGTGHDGKADRNPPKVGWCWAGNRHTWLGFASTHHRSA